MRRGCGGGIAWAVVAGCLGLLGRAEAVDTRDTRFLHKPALSADRLVFSYAEDLWTARPDGSDVRRLTAHPGAETDPYLSPDGKLVAFTGTYDGNVDAYVIPVEGGEPTRLTWHPGADVTRGFTPDGAVLFTSARSVFTNRFARFFTVRPTGGAPTELPIPSGERGAVSPDGRYLAYTPLSEAFRQWKNYRGGRASRIWVVDLQTLAVEPVPQPEGRCNDTYPMWVGPTVYFLSDRGGEFNLHSYDRATKQIKALTAHADFPIEAASAGAGRIVYEQAGRIFAYDPAADRASRLTIGVAADLPETRPRYADSPKLVRWAAISPAGKRVAVEFRGEVVSVPAEKGDPRNLTRTPDAHERSPAWSPDGKSIAYFTDASGEYLLAVRPADGKGETKTFDLKGAGFYEAPVWSPDSKRVAFHDNARAVAVLDLASGEVKRIEADAIYAPDDAISYAWSPDSRWLAYTTGNKAQFQSVSLYSVETGKSHRLTDGLAEAITPAFDASGKYLYFLASTDAGPIKNWFDQSNADMQATYSIFACVLAKATPDPLARREDEEGAADEPGKPKEADADKPKDEKPKDEKKPDAKPDAPRTVVDLDGLEGRIIPLPVAAGNLSGLAAGPEGTIYFLRRVGLIPGREGEAFQGTASLVKFDLKSREEEVLAEKVESFRLAGDRKHLLYGAKGDVWGVVEAGKFAVGKGALGIKAIAVRVDPRAEWPQMAHEAWRINRDYFYAPNMHGADWSGIRAKYEPFLADVPTRADLNWVIRAMLSELAVGHSYLSGGERLYEPRPVPVGLLGADFAVADGRYRFARIYGGLGWDATLRAPLVAPGVDVKAGEYLLAVDGAEVFADREVYAAFERKAGRRVELRVGPRADGVESRTVTVEPIESEGALRNRDWIERNLRYVREKTDGRVAYVYVPNTAGPGHASFKRYFFPQADREAVIVDERFNGGGQVADYYIDILRRPAVSWWATRHGAPFRTPGAAILGPKVMLIDETAGSGGDLLPWMFRRFGLGTLVGRRTWGGLVGILGFPPLMDGGEVTAPDLAFYTEDGWRVENEGVPPDVEVEQWPAAVAAGRDPQLDKAIEVALDKLKAEAPRPLPRPAFPVRTRVAGRP